MATVSKLNPNSFNQPILLGMADLAFNFNTKSAIINPNSTAPAAGTPIQVGQAVKLITGAVPGMIVDVAASTDRPYGVIANVLKKNTYSPGDAVEIACRGNVLYLETSAAISRNSPVQCDPTGPTVSTLTTGVGLGRALDQASGTGQLIRIEIEPGITV